MLTKTCGIDWSEAQQDVAIVDERAKVLARARVAEDVTGLGQLLAVRSPSRRIRGYWWLRWSRRRCQIVCVQDQ
jgi:hypothetical protein